MTTFHDGLYGTVHHEKDDSTMTFTAKEDHGDLSSFKQDLLEFAAHILTHKPKKVLVNSYNQKLAVGKDFQDWALLNLELPILNAGVEKIAMVLPKDNRHVALIQRENTVRKRYFETEKSARKWLEEN